ncbi:MAG: discoidin domain-containing protein [Hyphomicrobiales bacterium]
MSPFSNIKKFIGITAFSIVSLGLTNHTASSQEINALAAKNGTVVKSFTSEYGGNWLASGLIDGKAELGWSSQANKGIPSEFLFELPSNYLLSYFVFDNTKVEEKGYPGIAAKLVEVFISTQGETGPFQKVVVGDLANNSASKAALKAPLPARWVKLVIKSNGGHARYTELMEFSAFGTKLN